jgi:hypothetical protein
MKVGSRRDISQRDGHVYVLQYIYISFVLKVFASEIAAVVEIG